MRYQGMNVVVTGASSGIGEGFARFFHAEGATVVIVARRADKLQKLEREFNTARFNSCRVLTIDLTKRGLEPGGLEELCAYLRAEQIDILVNNAGCGSFGHFEEISLNQEIGLISLNIEATVRIAHAVIPQLKNRKSGGIISVSSIAAFQPLPFMATYAATKSFNFMHSMALRHELKPFGVKVLTVCPGPTATEFGGVARVPGQWTSIARDTVEKVVLESISAYERDKPYVVTGVRSKLMAFASQFLPVEFTTRQAGRALKGSLPEDRDDEKGKQG